MYQEQLKFVDETSNGGSVEANIKQINFIDKMNLQHLI